MIFHHQNNTDTALNKEILLKYKSLKRLREIPDQITSSYDPALNLRLYELWRKRFEYLIRMTRVKTTGMNRIPSCKPAILAPNHLNWKDIPFIAVMMKRPVHFVATARLFNEIDCEIMLNEYMDTIFPRWMQPQIYKINRSLAKFFVTYIPQCGAVPAKLPACKYSLIESARQIFRQNGLLCLFPEGKTGSSVKLSKFKKGIGKVVFDIFMETSQSIPVYPVGIKGTKYIYHPGMHLELHIGKPLYIGDFKTSSKSKSAGAFTEKLKKRVSKLIV